MNLTAYSCHTIQSAAGAPGKDGYLHIPGASLTPGTAITVWGMETRGVDFTNHF